jgi:hypothetical protein
MKPEALTKLLQEFLAEAREASIFENDEEQFRFTEDAATARYAISGEHGKCLLHMWSPERNAVRRVLDAERMNEALVLTVQRFGQSKPSRVEIFRERDRRTASARKMARSAYARLLERILQKHFPDWKVSRLTSAMDLEHSFSPVYARGLITRGNSAFAVLGVNAQESQALIDGALTFGVLWLDACRAREAPRVVEGLMLFLPNARSAIVRERIACLDSALAKFKLYELEECEQTIGRLDAGDRGNIETRLTQCVDQHAARERFADSIARVLRIAEHDEIDIRATSVAEISFRFHGLEVARARLASKFQEIVFGAAHNETLLTEQTEPLFADLLRAVVAARRSGGDPRNPLWRMQPERWLESLVIKDATAVDAQLEPAHVYCQVPAFSASDRAMIDVLAATPQGRLAVLELKADEDIHLPLQGLDYWARVQWHHRRREFQKFGYFAGRELSAEPPVLILVAPVLRIHPSTDMLLRHLSPQIEWQFVGIHERWREGVKVVLRKHSHAAAASA